MGDSEYYTTQQGIFNAGKASAGLSLETASQLFASTKPAALQPWYTAAGYRNSAPARIMFLGDSIMGGGGTATGASTVNQRIPRTVANTLRRRLASGAVGGPGWSYFSYEGPSYAEWAVSGTAAIPNAGGDLFHQTTAFGSGVSYTRTVVGTSMDLYYKKRVEAGQGNITVTVDGGSATNIDSNVNPATGNVGVTNIPFGSAGSHTIVVSATTNYAWLAGAYVYNGDETVGIQGYENVAGGTTSGFWAAEIQSTSSGNNGGWAQTVKTVQPAGLVVELGTNDYRTNVPAATFRTNLQAIIAAARTATTNPLSVVLLMLPGSTGTFANQWSEYLAAVRAIAAADPLTTVLDLSTSMTAPGAADTLGLWNVDGIHPGPKGHGWIADRLANLLTP